MDRRYRIELLGGLRVVRDGGVIDRFPTQRSAALLAYLACHDRPLPRQQVAQAIWWDSYGDSPRVSLRTALASLRQLLEDDSGPPLFLADRLTIRLNPSAVTTDIQEFESHLRDSDRDSVHRQEHLQSAFDLYHGEFAAGLDEKCLLPWRDRFRKSYLRTTVRLATALAESGHIAAALEICSRAVNLAGPEEELVAAIARIEAEKLKRAALAVGSTATDPSVQTSNSAQNHDLSTTYAAAARTSRKHARIGILAAAFPLIAVLITLASIPWNGPERASGKAMAGSPPAPSSASNPVVQEPPTGNTAKSVASPQPAVDRPHAARSTHHEAVTRHPSSVNTNSTPNAQGPRPSPCSSLPEFVVLDAGVEDSQESDLLGIDDHGLAVGWGRDANGIRRAMSWSSGKSAAINLVSNRPGLVATATDGTNMILLNHTFVDESPLQGGWMDNTAQDFPSLNKGANTFGAAANLHGHIVGFRQPGATPYPIEIRAKEVNLLIGGPGKALDLNYHYVAAGFLTSAANRTAAVKWKLGTRDQPSHFQTLIPLATPAGGISEARGINDRGTAVGFTRKGMFSRPVLWEEKAATPLLLPPAWRAGWANEINDERQIVGAGKVHGATQALYWHGSGCVHPLNELLVEHDGWELIEARDLNRNGWIVGVGRRAGIRRAFVLIPVGRERLSVYPPSIRTSEGHRAAGAFRLDKPAEHNLEIPLEIDPTGPAHIVGNAVRIRQGSRIGVFYVTAETVEHSLTIRITAPTSSNQTPTSLTLTP